MQLRHNILTLSILFLTAVTAAPHAQAQARVGEAVVVQKEVLRVSTQATNQINVGDGVLRDETVRTGLDSATRLVMADSTNLSLGANASITLDRTVFDDEHKYRDIAVSMTSGAFRFVTGHSEKAAYNRKADRRSAPAPARNASSSSSPATPRSSPPPPTAGEAPSRRPTRRHGRSPPPARRRRDFAASPILRKPPYRHPPMIPACCAGDDHDQDRA